MVKYSYKCKECSHVLTLEYSRGESPKSVACTECESTMERVVGEVSLEIQQNFKELPSKTEKIRKNIAKTEEKLNETKDNNLRTAITKWRLELNGGKY